MNTNNGMRSVGTPGSMNGESIPLNLTGKPIAPWAQLTSNKPQGIGPSLPPHMQQQQSPQTMPLSPPLTPLPPNLARFPPSPVLPASPYNPAANLQTLLLAAQCNPFLKNAPGMPLLPPQEMMENLQKLLQLRNQ